ncbi:hypothetical protein [Methylacidiphilum kamchatkense]|uniref:Uncharacterized protein n=1 Tax=Methylacidiphilum kamchatkense Kam1 TaxID=1202785 RepID=A0A516TMQ2_9BACT|nr:hypothetical protein [Methylacidiphilum kamchatkense]QDQ42519.1 hypothetical protein kam1_1294 [Methylacidiphilum kamchatkense Kam1]
MPIWLTKDLRKTLGEEVKQCDSLSLLLDKFPFLDFKIKEYRLFSLARVV